MDVEPALSCRCSEHSTPVISGSPAKYRGAKYAIQERKNTLKYRPARPCFCECIAIFSKKIYPVIFVENGKPYIMSPRKAEHVFVNGTNTQ